MSQSVNGVMTFIAGEALEPYRRVKLHSTPTQVVYADASDGDSWLGVTLPEVTGDAVASGDWVSVALRTSSACFKCMASAAVHAGDPVYPENDGKISDDAGTVVIGTCIDSGTAASAIASFIPNNAAGCTIDPDAFVDADLDGAGTPEIVLGGAFTFATATLTQTFATLTRKLRLIDFWVIARDTTAANIKLTDSSNDMTGNIAKGTNDATIVRAGTIVAAYDEVAAAGVIQVVASAACACDVYARFIAIA